MLWKDTLRYQLPTFEIWLVNLHRSQMLLGLIYASDSNDIGPIVGHHSPEVSPWTIHLLNLDPFLRINLIILRIRELLHRPFGHVSCICASNSIKCILTEDYFMARSNRNHFILKLSYGGVINLRIIGDYHHMTAFTSSH